MNHTCDTCNYSTTVMSYFKRHLKGKNHKRLVRYQGPSFDCHVCNFVTVYKSSYNRHLKTAKHLKMVDEIDPIVIPVPVPVKRTTRKPIVKKQKWVNSTHSSYNLRNRRVYKVYTPKNINDTLHSFLIDDVADSIIKFLF